MQNADYFEYVNERFKKIFSELELRFEEGKYIVLYIDGEEKNLKINIETFSTIYHVINQIEEYMLAEVIRDTEMCLNFKNGVYDDEDGRSK